MKKQSIKILALVMLFTFGIGISAYAFTTGYRSFAELAAAEDPSDYTIKTNDIGSDTTFLAIHGGGIERGTSELVEALNGYGKYNTYSFEGLKAADNGSLFMKAINFDEPTAVSLVNKSDYTVSVIGAAGDDEVTYIGGQNKLLAELIRLHLTTKGYNVQTLSIPDRIAGVMDSNIVNKNKLFNDSYQLGGVQIAISKGLRDKLATDSGTLNDYSGTINNALSESWPTIVELMKKIDNNKSEGFLNKFNPEKRNFDKKIQKVLEKGANNPKELIQDVKAVSEE
ncbi:poly-gamma-glutamate hydrolase family protein [Desulfoscipio gibsoniae]|uniref:Phage-related replication protein n=1 Tax=Desulfoscipio gibsoniae DSM 7213 TaxID=767817 RepID=R4KQ37_9FIRM|nr:poly-gamma-glutamate hydrolase family protein [Desulfoscipio gibsoniae]AGL01761.1 phage-related replication protein [Desulfoscipio gibsoniae DSM 7213]